MASYPIGLTRISLIICLLIFSSTSVGSSPFSRGNEEQMVLGSRPPQCSNRCFNCRPCMAALVSPPHHKMLSSRGDETYYLLAWKCRCGDKYFHP
ncbi:EPIDERMAL PATTERNING FACTOR-like protein 8 isoform X2 [Mercurialis annua]|uniref:EPIDERMAL PATTERNING FACTOR-like protein 8 isoform X2 n=1 Tax=Mercurialis annua TaxID=3986 RepID=UPI00215FD0F0|nr:EPIDERMAL PATTERNING FACTOR-like protein 8 isoform X2 [Mercurialis annua]